MGIHSNAQSMRQLISYLIRDDELKTLMKINDVDKNKADVLLDKYFQQTFVSNTMINQEICSLVIRQAPLSDTNNEYVKWNSVIIEIFVHEKLDKDDTDRFKRRILMIADKLIKMLHKKYIDSDLYKYVDGNELQSATPGFKRYFVMFRYKAVYA